MADSSASDSRPFHLVGVATGWPLGHPICLRTIGPWASYKAFDIMFVGLCSSISRINNLTMDSILNSLLVCLNVYIYKYLMFVGLIY